VRIGFDDSHYQQDTNELREEINSLSQQLQEANQIISDLKDKKRKAETDLSSLESKHQKLLFAFNILKSQTGK